MPVSPNRLSRNHLTQEKHDLTLRTLLAFAGAVAAAALARARVCASECHGWVVSYEVSLGDRALLQAIVDVAAQFCKLYWDRSSKTKVLRLSGIAL